MIVKVERVKVLISRLNKTTIRKILHFAHGAARDSFVVDQWPIM